jgi:hypothetical protein
MGEVYRADDLKLGQPVALKFLPPDIDHDPARLTQLHTEVRMARQVSHPNVCRVYDIDEVDGHTFLSMEYVDGEDLASLLKRVGRFPEERGLEIARQICAGLAAAHERGVVHRDLKPANVMVDGSGKVRITDFGLAGAAGETVRAGTPAYMAPEQLGGREVTARSDIYALGLLLYEIFSGHRALDGRNVAELIHKREQSGIVPPSALVRDLPVQIDRTVMRCLRPDPDERPASALAVAAALPGGDPLAAALAAGETPSPEIVASAGGATGVSRGIAIAAAAWVILALVAITVLYQRQMFVNRVSMPKPPEALQDRALEARARLGYGDAPAHTAWGLGFGLDYARHIAATNQSADRWSLLTRPRPASFYFWHRTSPAPLIPLGAENRITGGNPSMSIAGMTLVVVDGAGRLSQFISVPEPAGPNAPPAPPTDWTAAFDAAGLPASAFTAVEPLWVPYVFADERRAWEGRIPDHPDDRFRLEAAAYRGKLVEVVLNGPWRQPSRTVPIAQAAYLRILNNIQSVVMPGLILAAAFLARRNVTRGSGDRRGAFRAAAVYFATVVVAWLFRGVIGVFASDVDRFFAAVARGLYDAALLWITYLALEPYIRRNAPDSLIGWTRLIAGQWRDPRVAADVMIGVCSGLAMTVIYAVHVMIPPLFGRPEPLPHTTDANLLLGTRHIIGYLLSRLGDATQGAMLCVVGIVALRMLVKRQWLAALAAIACFTPVAINGMFPEGTPILNVTLGACLITVFVITIDRAGLLATVAALMTHFILLRAPISTTFTTWHGALGLWFLGAVAVLGLGSCYLASARPLSGDKAAHAYQPQEV